MTIDRTTAPDRAAPGYAHDPVGVPGKQTLTQQLPMAPSVAAATDTAEALGTMADAVHQLDQTVTRWYGALDRFDRGGIGSAGALAMMQWARILTAHAKLGGQAGAGDPLVTLARTQLGKLGLRQVHGGPIVMFPPACDGDPLAFIHARIEQAQAVIARMDHIMPLWLSSPKDEHGVRQPTKETRDQISMVVDGHPDPVEVGWLTAQAARFGLSLRELGADDDRIAKRLQHATDNLDISWQAQHHVDPALSERISSDLDRMRKLVDAHAPVAMFEELVKSYTPKDRALLLATARQRDLLFNMIEVSLGSSDDLVALIRQAPGFETFEPDRSRSTAYLHSAGYAAKTIGAEMARQAPGALTRTAAGFVDSFSSLPGVGRLTHYAADKLRDGSDALYDATGASKEGRGIANALSEGSGAVLAAAATMKISAGAPGVAGAKTALDAADTAGTIAKVIEEVQGVGEAVEKASEAWKMFAEIGTVAASTVIDAAGGAALGSEHQRERALDSLSTMIDVYLKRLEPAEHEHGEGLGHELKVVLLSALGAALKEIKTALMDFAKKKAAGVEVEPLEVREVTLKALAGFAHGGTLGRYKAILNKKLFSFIEKAAHAILERDHPLLVTGLKEFGEKPIVRLIDWAEERLKVEDRVVHLIEAGLGGIAG